MTFPADALCRSERTAIFFDDATADIARSVCRRCPCAAPCLAWALEHGEAGIWGSTDERQRDRLRRRRVA